MIYQVIPVMRTPHGVDAFDYQSDLTFQPGDAVWIPFRRGKLLGVVRKRLQSSALPHLKTIIGSYAGIAFGEEAIHLSQWLANTTFTSLPSIWKSWLRDYPKKPKALSLRTPAKRSSRTIQAQWKANAFDELIGHAMRAIQEGERIIIITPWKHRAAQLASSLDGITYTSDLNAGDAFRAWTDFAAGDIPCLVTTRVGAWIGLFADRVFLDLPEHDDHKQDDLAPRFDARKIALRLAEQSVCSIEAFGLNPPLHSDEPAPEIECDIEAIIRLRAGYSKMPMFQEIAYQRLLDEERPIVVIHPIKFELAKLTCRDCGWRPVCQRCDYSLAQQNQKAICKRCHFEQAIPEACEKCQSFDLGKSLPGIDKLKRHWHTKHPELTVDWRGVSAEELDKPLPENAIVLVTDGDLLAGAEDIRKQERLCHTFRRLAQKCHESKSTLLIQSAEQYASHWLPWLTTLGYQRWREHERKTRELFGYPPSKRVIKILLDDTEEAALRWISHIEKDLTSCQIRGPFEVATMTGKRRKRLGLHLLPVDNRITPELLELLSNHMAPKMYIDLDPISFFR